MKTDSKVEVGVWQILPNDLIEESKDKDVKWFEESLGKDVRIFVFTDFCRISVIFFLKIKLSFYFTKLFTEGSSNSFIFTWQYWIQSTRTQNRIVQSSSEFELPYYMF